MSFCTIKKMNFAALPFLPNFKRCIQVHYDISISGGGAIISHTMEHYLREWGKLFKYRWNEVTWDDLVLLCLCKQRSSIRINNKFPEKLYTILQKPSYKMDISNTHNIGPPCHFRVENKANSRTSLFKEEALDIAHNRVHDLILVKDELTPFASPFKA